MKMASLESDDGHENVSETSVAAQGGSKPLPNLQLFMELGTVLAKLLALVALTGVFLAAMRIMA